MLFAANYKNLAISLFFFRASFLADNFQRYRPAKLAELLCHTGIKLPFLNYGCLQIEVLILTAGSKPILLRLKQISNRGLEDIWSPSEFRLGCRYRLTFPQA